MFFIIAFLFYRKRIGFFQRSLNGLERCSSAIHSHLNGIPSAYGVRNLAGSRPYLESIKHFEINWSATNRLIFKANY